MIPVRHILIAALLAAAGSSAVADDDKVPPAEQDRQAKPLDRIIRDIAAATDLNSAAADYAEGRNIDRNSPALYHAYLIKTLELDRPRIALYPALELVRLDKDNGLAWATIAYNRARQGKYAEALEAALHAMALSGADPATQHNAANLIAWHQQTTHPPKLHGDAAARLAQGLRHWKKLEQFAFSYEAARKAYSGKSRQLEELEGQLDDASRQHRAASLELRTIDEAYGRNEAAVRALYAEVRRLRFLLRDVENDIRNETDPDRLKYHYRRRNAIRRDLGAAVHNLNARQAENDELTVQARQTKDAINAIAADIRKLQASIKGLGPVQPAFTWQTPTVKAAPPAAGADAAGNPKAPPAKRAEHQRLLSMAKLLLGNGFQDEAVKKLSEIVTKFPQTESAAEARIILQRLKGQDKAKPPDLAPAAPPVPR